MPMQSGIIGGSPRSEACDDEALEAEPGATTMWFGKHEGTRLDELDEWYRRGLVHLARENPSRNVSGRYGCYTAINMTF